MRSTPIGSRDAILPLPDGRDLAYAAYGPTDGRPVIFLPGAGLGRLMHFGGPLLVERGVQLIVVDRPGLGRSSPDPRKSFLSVAADLHTLLEALHLTAAPVVANSQGAPFGLATAVAGVASRLVLVSPSDEVADVRVRGQLPAELQGLVDHVGSLDPTTAAEVFGDFTADALLAMIMDNAPAVDAPLYADPDFRGLLEQAMHDGFAAGSSGYAADTALAMRPWGLGLDQIAVPVSIWFGADDTTHSPDHGRVLAGRIPGSTRHVIEHAGGLLLWSRPELILTETLRSGTTV